VPKPVATRTISSAAASIPTWRLLHFQIESLRTHAVWGLKAVETGAFAPPSLAGAVSFTHLSDVVSQAVSRLEALTPEEVKSWSGKVLNY
jgi:hypothetical protein